MRNGTRPGFCFSTTCLENGAQSLLIHPLVGKIYPKMRHVGLFSCISLVPRSNRPGKGHRAPSATCTVSKTHRHFAGLRTDIAHFWIHGAAEPFCTPYARSHQPLRDGGIRAVAPPRTRRAISCFHVPTSQQKAPHQRNRTLPISWVDNSTFKKQNAVQHAGAEQSLNQLCDVYSSPKNKAISRSAASGESEP